mmetsp:Transcript_34937/g.100382  ORF Transcript_34937/g.100382 Transcript_34937/m.100382 type:complete len:809 (-) Transcript_34937:1255-3681(-)
MRSSPGVTISMKSFSSERLLFVISPLSAAAANTRAALTTFAQALRTAEAVTAVFRFASSALALSRASSFLASRRALLSSPLGSRACCSAMQSWAAFTLAPHCCMAAVTASLSATGVANFACSASASARKGFAASSTAFAASSMACTLSEAGFVNAAASFFSRAWMYAFLSVSSAFWKLRLSTAPCFFKDSSEPRALPMRGFNFASSARASARGPSLPGFSSSFNFVPIKFCTLPDSFMASETVLSISSQKIRKAETCSAYLVPWLPSKVTKPTLPEDTTLHSRRIMPFDGSVFGPPIASKVSPTSTLATALPLLISKLSVTEIPLTQTKRKLKMSLKASRVTLPMAAVSMCLKASLRRSGVKATSSCPIASGNFSRYAVKVSSLTPPPAGPAISAKSASVVKSLAFMWSRKAPAKVSTLFATRNFLPPSLTRGAHTSAHLAAAASHSTTCSVDCLINILETYLCSWTLPDFRCFARSTVASFKRADNLSSVSVNAVLPLESLRLAAIVVLASSAAPVAALSWPMRVSHLAPASSADKSATSSFVRGSKASAVFLTSSSTAETFSPTACIWEFSFLASVSFLNAESFDAAELTCSVSFESSPAIGLAAPSAKCLISKFFSAMYVRVELIKPCASSAAASESAIIEAVSLRGSTSTPFRKGSSASSTLAMMTSTSAVFAFPSLTIASPRTCSRRSRVAAKSLPTFSCEALHLTRSPCSEAFKAAGAAVRYGSIDTVANFKAFCAAVMDVPIASMSSSEAFSLPSGFATLSARSMSSSICCNFSTCSTSTALPFSNFSPMEETFLCLDISP